MNLFPVTLFILAEVFTMYFHGKFGNLNPHLECRTYEIWSFLNVKTERRLFSHSCCNMCILYGIFRYYDPLKTTSRSFNEKLDYIFFYFWVEILVHITDFFRDFIKSVENLQLWLWMLDLLIIFLNDIILNLNVTWITFKQNIKFKFLKWTIK